MLILYILNFFSNISQKDDTFGSIAHTLCQNLTNINNYSIESLSKLCSVSQSSISRFAKIMDYENYNSFASSIKNANLNSKFGEKEILNKNCQDYFELHALLLKNCEDIFHKLNTDALKKDILNSPKVLIVGSPKPDATTLLQMELNLNHIECTNYYSPNEQYMDVDQSSENAFIIIYDCYPVDSILPYILNLSKHHRCLIITSNQTNFTSQADYILQFENQNFAINIQSASILTYALLTKIQQK